MHNSKAHSSNFQLLLIIIGLILLIVSSFIDYKISKVDIGEILATLSTVILISGLFQWFFDFKIRKELFTEISEATVRNINLSKSGLFDIAENSRTVDYSEEIIESESLILGLNYSSRILEDNIVDLKKRAQSGKKTTILLLRNSGNAFDYIMKYRHPNEHIIPNLKKVMSLIETDLSSIRDSKIEIIENMNILHYSFVLSDRYIWVKQYRNSSGISIIPSLQVKSNSYLYDFYKDDITKLIKGNESNG